MNIKKIASVAAAACLSANAYALAPTDIPDIELWMSGASAQDEGIEALFTQLCLPGTLDIYRDNGAKPGAAHRAFFCNLDSTQVPNLSITNPAVLFHKRSAGGSGQGVNPLVDDPAAVTPIEHMVIDQGNCAANGPGEWLCTASAVGNGLELRASTAGVSDVDPGMFRDVNTPSGSLPVDPSAVASLLDVTPAAALVFGIPVTTDLRDALQEIEIRAGSIPVGCQGSDSIQCMPSMSKHQIAALLSGQVNNWDRFVARDASNNLVPLTQAVSNPPTNNQVAVCRRVNGSGTQATANAVFLHRPCTEGALAPASTSNPFGGPVIVLNSGSGNVEVCLNDFNNGTNAGGSNGSLQKYWAIGVQSLEKNANLAFDYRFIKIDGVAPILENVYNGTYLDWTEQSFQWRKQGEAGAPNANQLAILEKLAADAANPAVLAPINLSKFTHPFGVSGFLALTVNGHTAGATFDVNSPVTPYSHAPSGTSLDNCRVPVLDRTNQVFPWSGFPVNQ